MFWDWIEKIAKTQWLAGKNTVPTEIINGVQLEVTLQNAATAVGNGTPITVTGYASLVLQVSGTFTATIVFEATQDGTNWVAILGQNLNSGAQVTSTTAPGLFGFAVAGLKQVRARISSYSSGSITVKGTALPQSLAGLASATYATIDSAPVVGVKTVTTTAAEIFAGASRLANRYAMIVYNESSVPVYWGASGVTTSIGFPLLPQDSIVFQFNHSVSTAIYFIASSNASVRVVELA